MLNRNINMVKILGCGLDADNFNISFKVDGVANTISIIPDPAHMVKLIRNAFGEKRKFIDMDGMGVSLILNISINC